MRYFFFIFFTLLYCSASAANIYVGAKRSQRTISSAINAAQPGDTIFVDSGIYREKNLIINKSIVLIGIGSPVLDGEKNMRLYR